MALKDDLSKIFRIKSLDGTYGIEIETEVKSPDDYKSEFINLAGSIDGDELSYKLYHAKMNKWKAKGDGSLRNFGIEYVLKNPLKYEDALKALDDFGTATKDIPFINEPYSASVHVHVNMWNETFLTLGNFITTYMIFESLLVHFCGNTRISNLFALPTTVAEGNWKNILNLFESLSEGNTIGLRIGNQQAKYATLNICPLTRLGSVEIRSMRGTTDITILKQWVSIINDILVYARRDITPRNIIDDYRLYGAELLFHVFGPERGLILAKNFDPTEIEQLLDRSIFYAATIADIVKDWRSLDQIFKKNSEKKKEAQSLSELYASLVGPGGTPEPEPVQTQPQAGIASAQAAAAWEYLYATTPVTGAMATAGTILDTELTEIDEHIQEDIDAFYDDYDSDEETGW